MTVAAALVSVLVASGDDPSHALQKIQAALFGERRPYIVLARGFHERTTGNPTDDAEPAYFARTVVACGSGYGTLLAQALAETCRLSADVDGWRVSRETATRRILRYTPHPAFEATIEYDTRSLLPVRLILRWRDLPSGPWLSDTRVTFSSYRRSGAGRLPHEIEVTDGRGRRERWRFESIEAIP
jgi:hypothetical protein